MSAFTTTDTTEISNLVHCPDVTLLDGTGRDCTHLRLDPALFNIVPAWAYTHDKVRVLIVDETPSDEHLEDYRRILRVKHVLVCNVFGLQILKEKPSQPVAAPWQLHTL